MTNRIPTFYNDANADVWGYNPNIASLYAETAKFRDANGIGASATDKKRTALLLIDLQRDFCNREGALYVGGRSGNGAVEDNQRIARFIYGNMGNITTISPTMDTHFPFQIFFSTFWNDENGNPVPAYTAISIDDIEQGKYVVSPAAAQFCGGSYAWARQQVKYYTEQLKKDGKYMLYLWPFHCVLGSIGHSLAGVIQEAVMFHSFVRSTQIDFQLKGDNPWTENYSIFGAEVLLRHDGKGAIAQKNSRLVETLLDYDNVVIAGQAGSHCTKSSIEDLITDIKAKNPALADKVYVMRDCMSPVTVPDGQGGFIADYTPEMDQALKQFEAEGVHLVESTIPMSAWPGIRL